MTVEVSELSHQQLDELIQHAESRKQELAKEQVRERIVALANAEGFSIDDLFSGQAPRQTRRPATAKYRNPADHAQTWSGRGKRALWFIAALAAGNTEKDLLI